MIGLGFGKYTFVMWNGFLEDSTLLSPWELNLGGQRAPTGMIVMNVPPQQQVETVSRTVASDR